jgi:hypothetical protein
MVGFGYASHAQIPSFENSSPKDSACINKSIAILYKIKMSGQKPVYQLNDEFFTALILLDTVSRKQKMVILNIGDDKSISFTIQSIHVNSYDSAGLVSFMKIDQEIPLIKETPLPHCETIGMNLGGFGLPGSKKSEILYARVSISWSGKDLVIELGEEQK